MQPTRIRIRAINQDQNWNNRLLPINFAENRTAIKYRWIGGALDSVENWHNRLDSESAQYTRIRIGATDQIQNWCNSLCSESVQYILLPINLAENRTAMKYRKKAVQYTRFRIGEIDSVQNRRNRFLPINFAENRTAIEYRWVHDAIHSAQNRCHTKDLELVQQTISDKFCRELHRKYIRKGWRCNTLFSESAQHTIFRIGAIDYCR